MAEIFAVETRGIGKPDYSREIAFGQVRPGLTLKYGQWLKVASIIPSAIASPYPMVILPIPAGGHAHLVNLETGFPLPYTLPRGYTLTLVQLSQSATEDFRLLLYLDGFFAAHLGTTGSGTPNDSNNVVGFSTVLFDPTALSAHTIDVTMLNLGAGALTGAASIVAIQEEVGTMPLPLVKTVRCKFCSHEWVVPRETTAIECPNCHELNIYCDFTKVRSIG